MSRLWLLGFLFIGMGLSPAWGDWKAEVKQLAKEGSVYAVSHRGQVLFEY
jgi:hypothetical protein